MDEKPEKHPVFKIALVTISIIGVFVITPWFDVWNEDHVKAEEQARQEEIRNIAVMKPTAEEEVEMLKDRLHNLEMRGCVE